MFLEVNIPEITWVFFCSFFIGEISIIIHWDIYEYLYACLAPLQLTEPKINDRPDSAGFDFRQLNLDLPTISESLLAAISVRF